MRRPVLAIAVLAGLSWGASPPSAVAEDATRVIVRDPYYLSLQSAEEPARGIVLVLHGGGWRGDLGRAADELMSAPIEALLEMEFDVANLGYRGGARSLTDATAAFRLLRSRSGPDTPICIYGASAGAQLALLVAARRGAEVDCVIDLLGPPDLEDFGSRPQSASGEALARTAFGASRLAALSPVNNVADISAPVLVGAAACDSLIDLAKQRRFVAALNAAGGDGRLQVIAGGNDLDLEHCVVDEASFAEFQVVTREFLGEAAPRPDTADPAPDPGEDGGVPAAVILAAVIVVAGVALFGWAVRR